MKPSTSKVVRSLFRAIFEEFENDPLPSRSDKGRFHDETTKQSTTYLAGLESTAWKEVTHRWRADPGVFRMAEVRVRLQAVVDLTDRAIQERYGVDADALTSEDYVRCQRLAARLRAEGIEAIWTYSRADRPDGRQLVVFTDQLRQRSEVSVVGIGPIER